MLGSSLLCLLVTVVAAQDVDPEEAAPTGVAETKAPPPFEPLVRWHDTQRLETLVAVRGSLGLGISSNQWQTSEREQQTQALAGTGARLSSAQPVWPNGAVSGPLLDFGVDGALQSQLGSVLSTVYGSWRADVPLAGFLGQSHPLRFGIRAASELGERPVWVDLAVRTNPYDYDRPLPVQDPYLYDALPTRYVDGVAIWSGMELSGGIAVRPVSLAPFWSLDRVDYRAELDNWDNTRHQVGLKGRAELGAIATEARGGFASSIARGDNPGTLLRELDPSWSGSTWGVEGQLNASIAGRPFFAAVAADVQYRSFRSADPSDPGHNGRKDVGLATRLHLAQQVLPTPELTVGLDYTVAYNHTNLDPNLLVPDANDFSEHRVVARLTTRLDLGRSMAASREP